jgi:para-nitrobenzyl esterase
MVNTENCARGGRGTLLALAAGVALACSITAGCSSGSDDPEPSPAPECEEEASSASACHACTHQGLVAGAVRESTCAYLGIPYAKPPVGERRFTAPEPADRWTGVREATAFGTACVQGINLSGTPNLGEDCLFVNVWTPETAPPKPLPVMVFLHGGGYNGGATNTYSGLGLSQAGPVVVVNMNYRVGALGFFAHPALDTQRPNTPSGSDGIRDQQLAMKWVKDNIASFHGDPNNITVFGESAGSSSVGIHLVSPRSRGLARRFMLESGVATRGVANGIAPVPRASMYARAEQMAAELCPGAADVIACLRGLPAERLMSWAPSGGGVQAGTGWVPVVEGPGGVLPDTPDALIARGEINPGEILVGTNKNEYGLFQLLGGGVTTREEFRARIQSQYPDSVDAILALYAPTDAVDANQANVTMMTDVMFRCATRSFARVLAAKGRSVYVYSFEQGAAFHSEEMTYVFGPGHFSLGLAPAVPALVEAIQSYWTNFAISGDPNGPDLVPWPKYDGVSDQHMTLVATPAVGSGLQKAACDFWDSYLATH